jgi:hypothetical protein
VVVVAAAAAEKRSIRTFALKAESLIFANNENVPVRERAEQDTKIRRAKRRENVKYPKMEAPGTG